MVTDEMVSAALAELERIARIADPTGKTRTSGALAPAFMRAVLEAAERAAWLPIETAPKSEDGKPTDVYFVCGPLRDRAGELYIAKAQSAGDGPEPLADDGRIDPTRFFWPPPTHWRPLPSPPAEA